MDAVFVARVLSTLGRMRRRERYTPGQLRCFQDLALRTLRNHAYALSPFYRRFHHGLADKPLAMLPVLTKTQLMDAFDDLVTDRRLHLTDAREHAQHGSAGLLHGRYRLTATSGSSGEPGLFVFNPAEWVSVVASFARGQAWSGMSVIRRQRMATVASGSPWHMSSQVAHSADSWLRPSLRIPATQPLDRTVTQLNRWQPQVLIAYASTAGQLAEEQLAGRLAISPERVFTSSEVLTARDRQFIHQAWGREPFDQYAATETAEIAAQFEPCGRLHLFEDLLITEVVDDHNDPVPPGTLGARLLVTSLFSRTQPLIRYALDDTVSLDPTPHGCRLGFAALGQVAGRSEDSLVLPRLGGGDVTVQPLVFNRVLDISAVSRWQIRQQPNGGLTLYLTGATDADQDQVLRDQLLTSLAQAGATVRILTVTHAERLPQTSAGKTPQIVAQPSTGPGTRSSPTAELAFLDRTLAIPALSPDGQPGTVN